MTHSIFVWIMIAMCGFLVLTMCIDLVATAYGYKNYSLSLDKPDMVVKAGLHQGRIGKIVSHPTMFNFYVLGQIDPLCLLAKAKSTKYKIGILLQIKNIVNLTHYQLLPQVFRHTEYRGDTSRTGNFTQGIPRNNTTAFLD